MKRRFPASKWAAFLLAGVSAAVPMQTARAQFGTMMSGAGAVNRSMGGASTAAPLSASGAMYWNPATITGLSRSELEASAELLFPSTQTATSVRANTFGPGTPPINMFGRTDSDVGAYPMPNIGIAYQPENSAFSFGLGMFAVAGFGVDYPGSVSNFLLTAPPPTGLGFGPVFSDFQVFQIHPAVAYQVTDRLSVAAGPTLNLGYLRVSPGLFATPNDANRDGFATYSPATHSEATWGAGFAVGVYYQADRWAVGASLKSPQWFDNFRFNSTDELGRPRQLHANIDLPMIVSVGASYTGIERWVFAADVRYLDYADTNFLGDAGFTADGAARGVGWKSIIAVALGTQYQMTDALSMRLGYTWNGNPIPDRQSFINTVSPVILEHTLYFGASWSVTQDFTLSLAYAHGFENAIEGTLVTPAGAVVGTSIRNATSADLVVLGATLKFGAPRTRATPVADCQPCGSNNTPPTNEWSGW